MANTVLLLLISLSFSGGLIVLLIFFICLLFQKKIGWQWQYYIWLVVIARLLLPFSPEQNLMGSLVERIYSFEQDYETDLAKNASGSSNEDDASLSDKDKETEVIKNAGEEGDKIGKLQNKVLKAVPETGKYLCIFWLIIVMFLLIRKITIYQSFVRFVKAGSTQVDDITYLETLAKEEIDLGIRKAVDLWINPIISSPMLIGFSHPCIVLPDNDLSEKEFHYTILHELVHYKRRDMYYKWIAQVVLCIHWFNPLIYFAARKINRFCELSCDEVVVKRLQSDDECREYAGTLLNAMASKGAFKERIASLTLSEDKKLLKERMEEIMNGRTRKYTVGKRILSVVLTMGIILTSFFAGSYTVGASNNDDMTISNMKISKQLKERSKSKKITAKQADKMALALTNKIWVWEWVEFFVPYMTDDGAKKLVSASLNSEWAGSVDMTTGKEMKFTQKQVDAARKEKPSGKLTSGDIDDHALMIMQSNGNWECVSFMLPYMTRKGIRSVVSCYNSKHGDDEKRAKDYY